VQPARAQVTLDIELDSEPIQGYLSRDGARQAFSGWIELVSLLQDVATTRAPQVDQPRVLVVAPLPEETTASPLAPASRSTRARKRYQQSNKERA
jgi:hypothetical protein